MNNIILSIIVILTISCVISKEPWQCDSAGKFICPTQETCCRNELSFNGWSCFPMVRGKCCPDGVSACPANTNCNLLEKKCENVSTLVFLEEPQKVSGLEQSFFDADFTAVDVPVEFVEGFLDGFGFFKNLPHEAECKPNDPQITQDLIDIVNIIKNINLSSDIPEVIRSIMAKATEAAEKIEKISAGCKVYAAEIKKVLDSFRNYMTSENYPSRLEIHTMSHFGEIINKTNQGYKDLKNENFKEAGKTFGELTKFVLLWDLHGKVAQIRILLAEDRELTPTEALEFAQGFNDGLTFFENLPHEPSCLVDYPQITKDVQDLIDLLRNFSTTDVSKILQILNTVGDAYQRVSKVSDVCNVYAQELKSVLDGMTGYVSQSGYYSNLVFHTLSYMQDITAKGTKIYTLLNAEKYREAGNAAGDFVKFSLLWGFKK